MKRLFLILTILLFTTSSFAQTGSPVQFSGGSKFKGGTLTSNLTMSDGALVELATGSSTNLALRLRGDTDTGFYSPSANAMNIVMGGSVFGNLSSNNINLGESSKSTGYKTLFLGQMAKAGDYSTVVGFAAGDQISSANAQYETAVGYQAGNSPISGARNTFIGAYAGHLAQGQVADVFNSTAIGNQAYTTASNQVVIGSSTITDFQLGQGGILGRFTSTMSTLPKPITHNVASNGYTIYQGNAAYSTVGEANVALPLNIAATSIAFDDGATGYIRAEVTGKNSTDSSCIHVELKAAYENFDDTLAFVGSPASITSQLNAATWSVVLSAADDDLSILATGTPGTIWQVKKLEIGGL